MIDAELLGVFLPEARGYLGRLGDPDARIDAAHGLKGACAMVGLDQLALLAADLEGELRRGGDGAELRRKIEAELRALETGSTPSVPEWDPDELRGLRAFFLDEAAEHLEAIAEAMSDLRKTPGAAAPLQSLLRKLHTLKGSAGSVLLDELSRLAHALEDRVVALRDRGQPLAEAELALIERDLERLAGEIARVTREVRGPAEPTARMEETARADEPTVRVEVERTDELMDAASELVFDRSRVARRQQELEGCVRDVAKVHAALNAALTDSPERLAEIATELTDVLSSLTRAVAGAGEDA